MPHSRAARMTRTAISPRLTQRKLCSTAANVGGVTGQDHGLHSAQPRRSQAVPDEWRPVPLLDPAITRDGRWSVWFVAETGSTNADLLACGDAPDRAVLV